MYRDDGCILFVVGFLLHILPQVTGIINHCMRSISVFFCDLCLLYDFTVCCHLVY